MVWRRRNRSNLYLISVSLFSSLYIHLQAGRFTTQRLREGPISLVASLVLDSSVDPYLCPSVCICSFVFSHLLALGFSPPCPVFITSHTFHRMPLQPLEVTSSMSKGGPHKPFPLHTVSTFTQLQTAVCMLLAVPRHQNHAQQHPYLFHGPSTPRMLGHSAPLPSPHFSSFLWMLDVVFFSVAIVASIHVCCLPVSMTTKRQPQPSPDTQCVTHVPGLPQHACSRLITAPMSLEGVTSV